MPKPPNAVHAREAKRRIASSGSASRPASSRRATESSADQHSARKLRLYEILYYLNQGFEQVLYQLQQLKKLGLGRQAWKAWEVMVEETRSEINFELVEWLAERGQPDRTYFCPPHPQR